MWFCPCVLVCAVRDSYLATLDFVEALCETSSNLTRFAHVSLAGCVLVVSACVCNKAGDTPQVRSGCLLRKFMGQVWAYLAGVSISRPCYNSTRSDFTTDRADVTAWVSVGLEVACERKHDKRMCCL